MFQKTAATISYPLFFFILLNYATFQNIAAKISYPLFSFILLCCAMYQNTGAKISYPLFFFILLCYALCFKTSRAVYGFVVVVVVFSQTKKLKFCLVCFAGKAKQIIIKRLYNFLFYFTLICYAMRYVSKHSDQISFFRYVLHSGQNKFEKNYFLCFSLFCYAMLCFKT